MFREKTRKTTLTPHGVDIVSTVMEELRVTLRHDEIRKVSWGMRLLSWALKHFNQERCSEKVL
jgi:hypothetical protein